MRICTCARGGFLSRTMCVGGGNIIRLSTDTHSNVSLNVCLECVSHIRMCVFECVSLSTSFVCRQTRTCQCCNAMRMLCIRVHSHCECTCAFALQEQGAFALCCSVLQCVLHSHCVAVCCSVLQCVSRVHSHCKSTQCECTGMHSIRIALRGGGLGSRPTKMYGERLGDGVEYHLIKHTPRR